MLSHLSKGLKAPSLSFGKKKAEGVAVEKTADGHIDDGGAAGKNRRGSGGGGKGRDDPPPREQRKSRMAWVFGGGGRSDDGDDGWDHTEVGLVTKTECLRGGGSVGGGRETHLHRSLTSH